MRSGLSPARPAPGRSGRGQPGRKSLPLEVVVERLGSRSPGRSGKGPRAGLGWQELGAASRFEHPLCCAAPVVEIATDDLEVLQAVVPEPLLAGDIGPVPLPLLVVGSVVLADQAGHRVEQVRYAEEAAVEIVQLAVADRR